MVNNSATQTPVNAGGEIDYTKSTDHVKLVQRAPATELKLFLTGPGGAGKTRLLYNLFQPVDETFFTIPTIGKTTRCIEILILSCMLGDVEYYSIHRAPLSLLPLGFNVETMPLNSRIKASVTIWDAGGHSKMSHLFRHYYAGCRGIIFVIPSFWGEDGHNNCFWSEYKIDKKPKAVNIPEHVICILARSRAGS